jgi:hypothetical protein
MIYSGHTGYLDDIASTVRDVTDDLKPHKQRFDFLAVTGMSGVLVGSPVAIRLHRPLVVVRKDRDICHSGGEDLINRVEANGRYLILDDFISMGNTYRRLRERFDTEELAGRTRYAGTYLYSDHMLSWEGDGLIRYDPDPSRYTEPERVAVKDYTPPLPPLGVSNDAFIGQLRTDLYRKALGDYFPVAPARLSGGLKDVLPA